MIHSASPQHNNSFQLIRILLAVLVVFGHAFNMVRVLDPLEVVTGVQLAGVAVDGFFIISGFLIAASYRSDPSPRRYLLKRVRRIYPGFLVALAISLFVIGPVVSTGNYFAKQDWLRLLIEGVTLNPPNRAVGVFDGVPFPLLNGALWTIHYEFLCYLLILVLGVVGILSRPRLIVGLAVLTTIGYLVLLQFAPSTRGPGVLGRLAPIPRFATFFLAGSVFQIHREWLRVRPALLVLAIGICAGSLPYATLSQALCPWLGGMALLGLGSRTSRFSRWVDSMPDVSYGTYLYAWPIENLIIAYVSSSPWVVFGIALILSLACGCTSWFLIEKPWLRPSGSRVKAKAAVSFASSEHAG